MAIRLVVDDLVWCHASRDFWARGVVRSHVADVASGGAIVVCAWRSDSGQAVCVTPLCVPRASTEHRPSSPPAANVMTSHGVSFNVLVSARGPLCETEDITGHQPRDQITPSADALY